MGDKVDKADAWDAAVAVPPKVQEELDALREYAIETTRALTGLTFGGSEFFKGDNRFGFFEADIGACVKNIEWRKQQSMNLAAAKERAKHIPFREGD